MSVLVSARAVCKSFPVGRSRWRRRSVRVLNDINIEVRAGEMVAIVGPSGSGKSTLLYCLSGSEAFDSGSVRVAERELHGAAPDTIFEIRRDHITFVFQSHNLIPSLSASENVALPARLAGHPLSRKQVNEALERVGLAQRARARIDTLSGGERQRVAVARALASDAQIVFADEPTASLDSHNASNVLHLLRAVPTDPARSVVMVTHNLEAAALADRVVLLRDGSVAGELARPTAQEILEWMEASR
ncbi:ABC transporter ATP-binding protein [Collinsella sp. An2]|uniref:ABC transporter ATP-binding protein n=1 Tax=Collinsella sp. An2 TaxID=1965585 RepID=UPI000B38F8CD|nr:ABC transporter ATP-binding protein [Collinsella sp. An2]OUP08402.1 ABC transporter [Collinsella sp. An2]